jgi:hypothetical protein
LFTKTEIHSFLVLQGLQEASSPPKREHLALQIFLPGSESTDPIESGSELILKRPVPYNNILSNRYCKINKRIQRTARKIRKQFQKKKTTGMFPSRLCVIGAFRNRFLNLC